MRIHCDNHHCTYGTSGGRCRYPNVVRPDVMEKVGCSRRREQLKQIQ